MPNLVDAFVGKEIVLHLAQDLPLELAEVQAALKKHAVEAEEDPEKDPDYLL